MAKTKLCKYCRSEIDKKASVCPYCQKKQSGLGDAFKAVIVAIALIIFVPAFIGAHNRRSSSTKSPSRAVVEDTTAAEKQTKTKTKSATETKEEKADVPGVSKEYSNALKKAERYSNNMHLSKAGIYKQLTSTYGEGFSEDAANYAIEHMSADFKTNALYKAQSYSDSMHLSKAGIYDQLTSEYGEQFTPEEAQYAVDNVAADFKDNALQKARSYQDSMAMSSDAIYKQ